MAREVRSAPEFPDMEVLRQIGGGSYGEIWMARSVTGTLRAVKVVYRNDFDDDKTFEREFEGILKYEPVAREYPGLVDILHVGRDQTGDEEFYFYVMELGDDVERGSEISPADYEARTLRSDMLRAGKRPLAVSFCAEAGERLAGALAHLHEKGLAHRDVKPSNVIFVKGQACLADIGLVAARDQRTFVGTEGFVPPEGPGSAGADVYALGKVLYEMATGKDRLDFPELPDEPIPKMDNKRWLALNKVICETCDSRLKKRRYTEAAELQRVLSLIHRAKRIRRKRIPVGLVSAVGIVFVGIIAALVFRVEPLEVKSSISREDIVPTSSIVTVNSIPERADVYSEDGVYLGEAPYGPKEFSYGAEVSFSLRLPGHEEKEVLEVLTKAEQIIIAELDRAPPDSGNEWRDSLGQRYFAEDESHLSAYPVGPEEFKESSIKSDIWKTAEVTQNGIRRRAAFVTPELARKFTNWLAKNSEKDGVTKEAFRFETVFEPHRNYEGVRKEVREAGLQPFRIRVIPIGTGKIDLETEPVGAFVSVDGKYLGTTPLNGVELFPGEVVLRIELDGYEDHYTEPLEIRENERISVKLIKLSETKGMPWQVTEWKNSLGMEFVEVDEELLAAKWETRVRDFQSYVTLAKVQRPKVPKFKQNRNHPIVNVSREEAIAFCEWLTARERTAGRIREWHYYRLPTDLEWSQFALAGFELGASPQERALEEKEGFPWGDLFPPDEKVVNVAGMEGSAFEAEDRLLEGYDDGYIWTSPVGSFEPNALGLHDLGGNVGEWVSDSYTLGGNFGTARGGSWQDYRIEHLRTGARRPLNKAGEAYGFRIVLAKLEQEEEFAEEDNG